VAGEFADAELAAYVAQGPPPLHDVAALRSISAARSGLRTPGPQLHSVTDLRAGDCPARLYHPLPGPLPLLVYLHGGGWTTGDLDSHDRVCRRLAAVAGVALLALDYRLAPEHPWPASVDDAVAALRWVATDPVELRNRVGRLGVGGDSAGGALAALACLRLRDEAREALPDLQLLIYANTDLTGAQPSMREKATGYGLEAQTIRFFNSQWVADPARWADPAVSPLHAPDLGGLPAALVISAEHDPLRDEAEAFAERLRDAGVEVQLRREPGLIHGFLNLDEVSPACAAAADRIAEDVGARLRAR
jgi:acetyl esterase